MAISAANAVYLPSGPAFSGQVIATGGSDQVELAYKGVATITLDGASTSAVINFIDGVQILPFTPSGVIVSNTGGTQNTYVGVSVTGITNTGFTVNLSAAGTSANTIKLAFLVLK